MELRVDVDIEKTFALKVRDQCLAAFLHQLRIDAHSLVHRQQRLARPAPKVCALHLHVNGWPRLHIEMNIGAVGFGRISCPGKFHLGIQLAPLLQPLLQILLGLVQGRAAIVLARPDRRSPQPAPSMP